MPGLPGLPGLPAAIFADAQRAPIRGSASNRFYQRHGFVKTDEAEWDIHYLREPRDGPRR